MAQLCMTCVLLRLLTYCLVFVTLDASALDFIDSLTTNFTVLTKTYTFCNLQDGLWPLIIPSASISVFLLYWIGVYQEVYVFQTRYVLFPLQLLRWSSFSFLHAIRSKFLIYQKFLHARFHIKELGLLNILLVDDSPFFTWYVALS